MAKKIVLSTLVATVILFLWSGLAQNFPWGVPSVQVISTQGRSAGDALPEKTIELPPGTLTTEKFEQQMVGKITTLTTDKSFSWVITKPLSYYNLPLYFTRELITQLVVSLLLSLILWNVRSLGLMRRLGVVLLAASATVVATHLQEFNWMGTPPTYAFGVALNLVAGWFLAALVVSKFVLPPSPTAS